MEKVWRDIFRITEDEEAKFGARHSHHIEAYIRLNEERVKPHQHVDLNRINNMFYTRKIEEDKMIRLIKKKNETPGTSRITKPIIENCPPTAIIQLKNIQRMSSNRTLPNSLQKRSNNISPKT